MRKAIAFSITVFVAIMLISCGEEPPIGAQNDQVANIQVCSTTVDAQRVSESVRETLYIATEDYFDNLNKDYSPQEIIEEVGPCKMESPNVGIYVWQLTEGSEATVFFSNEVIVKIIIDCGDSHDVVYERVENE